MQVHFAGVRKSYGGQAVLDDVTLTVGPHARLGVVGPNGVGKSTLLRILAGVEEPDAGTVLRASAPLAAGYLEQERDARAGESLLDALARRTGVARAERALELASAALARGESAAERYVSALEQFLGLGGADFEARARITCAELGLSVALGRPALQLSGGEAARAALAAILLSRFELLLLDEPTNDLDFDGLDRLEQYLDVFPGALVVVSHDRALLDRTVTGIVEIDPSTHRVKVWSGCWSDYAAARETERRAAYGRYAQAVARRRELAALLAKRRSEARGLGDSLGKATGGADRRASHALQAKVRQTARLLERNPLSQKPFEPWELRLSLQAGERPGDLVVKLESAVAVRGAFRLGPVSLDLVPGERVSVVGRNGSGKTTLLGMLLGDVPLAEGRRVLGRRTTIGAIAQSRSVFGDDEIVLSTFRHHTALAEEPARTLLAKFGLGAHHVRRPGALLSPGERTRAELARLQALRVNLIVLDEPTNHLDVEAVEQLEVALASYTGTLVLVSHDRCFLEAVAPLREVRL